MRVHIFPEFAGEDKGDGGVRRVVEGQRGALPAHGIELIGPEAVEAADVLAVHIAIPPTYLIRYPDKPIVAHCHGLYWAEYEWPNWALKANVDVMGAIRVADIVTAPSEWVAEAIRRHTCRDVRVVPHGIDVAEWSRQPLSDTALAVLAEADEGCARAIVGGQPYVLWNKTRPDPVCDPEPMNILAGLMPGVRFVSTFGRPDLNVTVTDRQPFEIARNMVCAAGVYLCTTRETFGVGTLEALAAGVPVVGWRWGGQAEIIEHGVDGWLADPGDFPGLVKGVQWALEHREALAPACRAKAERYTWDRAGAMYADIYREAFARRAKTSRGRVVVEPAGLSAGDWRDDPRVSIIVTAYNLEAYLSDTLDSVAAQTAGDWECIIVDDASPDRCGEIADQYAARDPRFRVIHNAENQYLAGARNTAIAQARGRYILPLDADDMIAPETVEVLAGELDRQRSVAVAYGNVLFVNEDGRTRTIYAGNHTPGHSGWPIEFRHDWQLQPPNARSGRPPNLLPYCSMYRREAWELTGGYRARLRTAEDADFWCRLSSYGFRPKMVTTLDTLIYRNREGSMSRSETPPDWSRWFPWARAPHVTPAGACTEAQLPVPSCDPPAIAVIIPVGPGHESIVLDAIDSVDAQTFRQWECIVVNDTGQALPPLPTWAHVIEAPHDRVGLMKIYGRFGGVAAARNAGIRASRAKLFLPLDADDLLEPEALATLHEEWTRTGDIIYPDFWEDPDEPGVFSHYELPDYDRDLLIRKGSIHAVTALTPKAAWEAVGGYDEGLPGWEDWGFQIACAERCICTHRYRAPLFIYRKHTGRRRADNFASFDESKAGIVAKFGDYWDGGKVMPGCGSCGGGRSSGPVAPQAFGAAPPNPSTSDALLVRYVGQREGDVWFTGQSRTRYLFGKGAERYVLTEDVAMFEGHRDFEIVRTPPPAAAPTGPAPALQVARAPEPAAAASDAPPAEAWGPAVASEVEASDDAPPLPPGVGLADAAAMMGATPHPLPTVEEAFASSQTRDLPEDEEAPALLSRRKPAPTPRPGVGKARTSRTSR